MHGDSTVFSAYSADGVSAMADSVSSVAEEAEVQTVTGGPAEARCESPCSSSQEECSQG